MSFEKFNPFNKKPENRYTGEGEKRKKKKKRQEEEEEEENDFDPSKRKFLKVAGTTIVGGLFLSHPLRKLMEESTKEQEREEGEKPAPDEETPASQGEEALPQEPTEEQEKIEQENVASLSETLDYEKEGRIELNSNIMEEIKNHWKERYKNDPKLKTSLEEAYKEMGGWEPDLRKQFKKQEVPEKYAYLAIPESHWQLKAKSGAGAVGPYQFMPKTGRAYGLKMDYFADHPRNLDERQDPIKSAGACARLLKDLHQAGGDWDLALSGYNGGYFWRYLKNAQKNNEEISYNGFLSYMEEKINKIKEDLKSHEYEKYEIKPGENVNKIANKFNINTEELCRINGIKNKNTIYAGQVIKIPISEETKKGIFENKIRGMAENLNYPAKFNAVHELIEEGFVQEKQEPIPFSIENTQTRSGTHVFKKEDENIYQLSLKLGVDHKEILRANPGVEPRNLAVGKELVIPRPTLRSIAEQKNKNLDEIRSLNPAIKDPEKPIPKGYKIRM